MTKFICLLFLFSTLAEAAPLSFSQTSVKKLQGAATVRDVACLASDDSQAGRELCATFTKSYSVKNTTRIQWVNDGVLLFKTGNGSVKLERTEESMRFLLNDRVIDLNKYPNQERLGFAIEAALAPRAAGLRWIDRAFAAEVDPSIKANVQSMLVLTAQNANCDSSKNLVETCNENLDPILSYFKNKKPADQAKITADIRAKVQAVNDQLNKADGRISAYYGFALQCDCKDNDQQFSCSDQEKKKLWGALLTRNEDPKKWTVPRQVGLDRCQRFLKLVIEAGNVFDLKTNQIAQSILRQVDENVAKLKAESSRGAETSK